MSQKPKTVEERLAECQAQSLACIVMPVEREFIVTMRGFVSRGVGYGWMQQIIEWEWQSKHVRAWGPERFHEWLAEKDKLIGTLAKLLKEREYVGEDQECYSCDANGRRPHKTSCECAAALRAAGLEARVEGDGDG